MQRLAEICVRRPVFATMLIVAITVAGVFGYTTLGVDQFPNVDFPVVTVVIANPGASASEIERDITEKVESAVNAIGGVKEVRSSSVEGISQVNIQFSLNKNFDVAAQEVRDKVSSVIPELPKTIEPPTVQKFETNASPVIRLAVASSRPLAETTRIARREVKEQLETLDGVGRVSLLGGARRETRVSLDPLRLQAYGLTPVEVAAAVQRQNQDAPTGGLAQGARETALRTPGKPIGSEALRQLPIAYRGQQPVRLGDVAQIEETIRPRQTITALDGRSAVIVQVSKRTGGNAVALAAAVKARLADIRAGLPPDVVITEVGDKSVFIEAAVNDVKKHLVEGSLLACLVVLVFLRRVGLTLIAALAIPTSVIGAFGVMAWLGYTLDMITLLALTLMVGVVIDDAIVVLENIERFIREKGYAPFEAAVAATREIGLAVLATTLSLLAVFLPTAFMGGIVGRFLAPFGVTASAAVAISMLVSFTLTPMLCARALSPRAAAAAHADGWLTRAYTWLVAWSVRHRGWVAVVCVGVAASVVPLFIVIGKDFIPQDDESQFEVTLRAPEGTSLAATALLVERIAADLRTLPGVTNTLTTAGSGDPPVASRGYIYVKLAPLTERSQTQAELIGQARDRLKRYADQTRFSVQPITPFSGGGYENATIQYVLRGPELDRLAGYAEALMKEMRGIPGVVDVNSTLVLGVPELRVRLDRQRADDLGVAVEDVATTLNILVAGMELGTLAEANVEAADQPRIRLRAPESFRSLPERLGSIAVPTAKGGTVPLANLARLIEGQGPVAIERLNRQRYVTVLANVAQGSSLSAATEQIDAAFNALELAPGYERVFAGDAKDMAESAYYFAIAFGLTFVFMYVVLAAQFESFIHPVTILLTLPLALPFGLLSLLIAGQSVNLFVGLGVMVLFAVVKKNAILQIDHMNGLRRAGWARDAAIVQANRDRLRPILMTTLAFVAGMIPLALSQGPGAGTNRSISVLVIGGQSLCLLLTLLAVPAFYALFDDMGVWLGQRWSRWLRFARAKSPVESESRN
ncbi:efflux RND transporter permease subunit [Chloracidobacterium validum]|uniref:Efflux RND transporter permease subunit n=1 Tax=Chloracidobacterium validum TaxID=2821543 RepID=A0ABX8BEX1_9BACT|nr:efflux RND transporter permease subunit [Chloracidobacterium validum]QUW04168.1 efflux RND transporter permease subunit [Chloracidobacterium validum]